MSNNETGSISLIDRETSAESRPRANIGNDNSRGIGHNSARMEKKKPVKKEDIEKIISDEISSRVDDILRENGALTEEISSEINKAVRDTLEKSSAFKAYQEFSELRRNKDSGELEVPKYPGKESGLTAIDWYVRHYKKGTRWGIYNSTTYSKDRSFSNALYRELREAGKQVSEFIREERAEGGRIGFMNVASSSIGSVASGLTAETFLEQRSSGKV